MIKKLNAQYQRKITFTFHEKSLLIKIANRVEENK